MSVKIMVFSALIIFMGTLFISSDILAFGGADIVSMEKLAQKAVVSIDAQKGDYRFTPSEKLSDVEKQMVVYVSETIHLEETVFDGYGKLYIWIGEGKCDQTEGGIPMFRLGNSVTLQNLFMFNAQEGIHVKGSNTIVDNVVNLDVCEDALSIKTMTINGETLIPSNIIIRNSVFLNCEDKGLQLSRGLQIHIENNTFKNCHKPIRLGGFPSWPLEDVFITNNKASQCNTFILISRPVNNLTHKTLIKTAFDNHAFCKNNFKIKGNTKCQSLSVLSHKYSENC